MIGFEGVSKRYRGGRLALDDVTFTVPDGGSLGLVGESGSGKTTCVRLALGLDRPTTGRLTFGGTAYPSGSERAAGAAQADRIRAPGSVRLA